MSEIIFRGCGFDDCYINVPGSGLIYMIAVLPVAVDDPLRIEGVIEVYDGEPVGIFHGEDQVGAVGNSGMFGLNFTATSDNTEFHLACPATSNHHIGYLQIERVE